MANIVKFLRTDVANDWIKSKFSNENEIVRFKSNLIAITNSNELLQKADPKTIMTACYQGVLLNLPMEKQFGYAYVVPYNTKITRIINGREIQEWVIQAQFQMGYKGYIQLAQRSGQYLDMSVSDVKDGELINYDRLKGTSFNWIQNKDEREKLRIIGYAVYFKMVNGFEKTLYMTREQMENHFMKYSKTYAKNKKFMIATFDEMALKTVLKSLLRKWGIMSVELQQAYKSDQAVITTNDKKIYIDNDSNIVKNQGHMSHEPLSNNINFTPCNDEIAYTNDNVVKEEDISNVVPSINNDEDVYAWKKIGIDPSGSGTTAIVVFENNILLDKQEFINKDWKKNSKFIINYLKNEKPFGKILSNNHKLEYLVFIKNCLYTNANCSKDRDDLLKLLGSLETQGYIANVSPRHTKSVVKNIENESKYYGNKIYWGIDSNLTYQYGKGWKYNNDKISNHLRDAIIIAN